MTSRFLDLGLAILNEETRDNLPADGPRKMVEDLSNGPQVV